MIGCPGAGKSTWIKRNLGPGTKVVSRDIVRWKLGMTSSPEDKYLGTREEEDKVTREERRLIGELVGKGRSFVIDDTNLNSKFTKDLLAWLHYLDCYCIGVFVSASWNDIKKRRQGQIPQVALRSLWEKSKTVDLSDYDEVIRVS
jgi:predicted kinase